jgi:type I restriction enzyme M protein
MIILTLSEFIQISNNPMHDYALGQHYTGSGVAKTLSELIGVRSPGTVIDLGVGEGSLLIGANDHWRDAALHGIDIDQHNLDLVRAKLGHGTFGKADCLSETLSPAISDLFLTADVVLCNPPFLEFAHNTGSMVISQDWRQTAEVRFFEISLQLLRPGGSLGIIFPARYVSGPAYREFRKQLLETCNVVSVTHLPASTFKTAEVEAYFLVLRKEAPAGKVKLQALSDGGILKPVVNLTSQVAVERMDYCYHSGLGDWVNDAVPLAFFLTEDVCRGIESSGRTTPESIFHTSSFKFHSDGYIRCPTHNLLPGQRFAVEGDILIPRVGSRCLHYAAQVQSGETLFSDCVYRLRVDLKWHAYVLTYLRSRAGIAMRHTAAHGTCVKILSKQAILDLPVPMMSIESLDDL